MLAVQFALLVAFFLLPRVKPATSPPSPSDERTHRFHSCHQPEEKNSRLRYVPDHLLHSNKSRDVDPSKVAIFCVFHNYAYRKFKKSGRDVIFFGEAAYRWLTSHKFDGLNLDWPYAGGPCGSSSDLGRYAALLRSLKTRFQSRFMLTVAVPGELEDVRRGLDLLAASEVADFLLLRSHRRRNLDPSQYDCPGHAVAPVFFALKALAPNAKICISISFEVRAFKLVTNRSETNTRMEPADPTGYTGTPGLRAFSEVCRASDVSVDPVKYCTLASATRNLKIALETPLSIRQKLTVLSKPCVVLWDMEFDDFEGRCSAASRDPWPLTAAVYNALN
ncbi:hypothetical protein MTO96_005215 [Rhipicephalus appendiculatus]